MDLVTERYSLSPTSSPATTILRSPSHSSDTSFPIIAIAVIGILATAFLLVSYYIFVIKCCLSWHRIDLLRRFSLSRRREETLMAYSQDVENRGLDEAVIRLIPMIRFKKEENNEDSFCECAVCLNEFQEDEKLRIIPNCTHLFHIDCIDVWLQNNANCPLCRMSVSINTRPVTDRNCVRSPSPSPQDPLPFGDNLIGGDEDFVVIELNNHESIDQALLGTRGRSSLRELSVAAAHSISPSPRKKEMRFLQNKGRKLHKVTSMGDECIDIRGKDDQFSFQPIRRSFSMDSSGDRQLYLAVQEALKQQNSQVNEVSLIEGCSTRAKRSFFSFGHGSSRSKSAVLPVHLEP